MPAYYNELEPYAAEWLRNLIKAGHIADGEVDGRSIVDVRPDDLRGFDQCHFFAGIGVWSYTLRLAGWPDDRPVWTGSCPCQPFSAAGKGKGFDDERHLWPVFHRLIAECRPPVVFGEQVASKDGLAWFDVVHANLQASGYACGAVDWCAAGIGAPHIRQRLWFVAERLADAVPAGWSEGRPVTGNGSPASSSSTGGMGDDDDARREGHGLQPLHGERQGAEPLRGTAGPGATGGLGHHHHQGLEGQRSGHQAEGGWLGAVRPVAEAGEPRGMADAQHDDRRADEPGRGSQGRAADGWNGATGRMADDDSERHQRWAAPARPEAGADAGASGGNEIDRPSPTNGHWRAADWLHCRDGKWRPVEPGTFPLVDGAAFKLGSGSALEGKSRVGMLRAYGNAIVAPVAAEFVSAFMEYLP